MAGKRLQKSVKRRKKKGKALLISRIVRLGMLAVLVLGVCLILLGVRACADYLCARFPSAQVEQEPPAPSADKSLPHEAGQTTVFTAEGVVTIDPGHGGADPGCGQEGALEKDIALPISMALKDLLEQAGVTVIMTRQTDETVSLDDRAVVANNAGSDLFVSIHCNSFEGQARGMDCYYHKSESAMALAQSVLDRAADLGITTRQIQKNNYQVLWDTDMPAVLVETGFLTDPEDCALLCRTDYQKTVAQAIATAVLEHLRGQTA